jgi:hypothetical protein
MTTTHRITTTAAAILTLAGASGPAAAAGPPDAGIATATHPAPATAYSRQDKSVIPLTSRSTSANGAAIVRIQTPQSGFDWGDAGIGAAGGFALSMIGLGGVLVVTQRRGRRPVTAQASSAK